MTARPDQFYVVTPPGFEKITRAELLFLDIETRMVERGGVTFAGGLQELYLSNLWLRSASRILVRLGEVGARDFPTLFQRLARLPWGRFVKPGSPCNIRVAAHQSRLNHTGRIAETCQAAISKALGQESPLGDNGLQIFLRFVDNRCIVSVDSSGELLHRRGYRKAAVNAPLRENLAAACLLACGYDGSEAFVDPLCGSGTFAAEAGLIALKRAPGVNRSFAFMQWPGYRNGLWQQLLSEAQRQERSELEQPILASDNNPKAVAAARENISALGFQQQIQLSLTDMQQLEPPCAEGLLISNPPYGERLGANTDLGAFYTDLGRCYAERFSDWRGAVICPENSLPKMRGMHWLSSIRFSNGGLKVALWEKA